MKKLRFLSVALLSASMLCLLTACPSGTGEVGPKGDKGDKGDTGAQGPAGSVNAKVINWTNITVPAAVRTDSPRLAFGTALSNAQVPQSAIIPYGRIAGGSWWMLPVANNLDLGSIGARIDDRNSASGPALILSREVGQSLATTFSNIRAVVIPDLPNGRKAAIDYSNYEEVKKAYNLPD